VIPFIITTQWLDDQIAYAVRCSIATIPREHFHALMSMAKRVRGYEESGLRTLQERFQDENEVMLTGRELKVLLEMAKQASRLRPLLRVVPVGKPY
jgi:hypothetical protein